MCHSSQISVTPLARVSVSSSVPDEDGCWAGRGMRQKELSKANGGLSEMRAAHIS